MLAQSCDPGSVYWVTRSLTWYLESSYVLMCLLCSSWCLPVLLRGNVCCVGCECSVQILSSRFGCIQRGLCWRLKGGTPVVLHMVFEDRLLFVAGGRH